MARGGKREGAGRKKGTLNKLLTSVADMLDEMNCNPLQNLARVANGEKHLAQVAAGVLGEVYPTLDQMVAANKELAQYVAPKRKAIEHTGTDGEPLQMLTVKLVPSTNAKDS